MDAVLRRIGIKKGEPRESEARLKLQKELFAFTKVNKMCFHTRFMNVQQAILNS